MQMRYASGRREGIDAELEKGLDDFENFPGFSDREKAALRYTDEIYLDDITSDYDRVADDLWARMRENYSEQELVELTWAICFAIEYGRLFAAWGVPAGSLKERGADPDVRWRGDDD